MMKKKRLLAILLTGACAFIAGSAAAMDVAQTDPSYVVAAAEETYAHVYDFTSMTSFEQLSDFKAGIDPYESAAPDAETNESEYDGENYQTYAKDLNKLFTLNGGLKVNTDMYLNENASENRIYVRLDAQKLKYYKAELVYNSVDSTDGWAGLFLGMQNTERQVRWPDNPNGFEIFMQKGGKPTYASAKLVEGFKECNVPAGWEPNGDHTLRIKVNQEGIFLNVDGVDAVTVTAAEMAEKNFQLVKEYVGFMFTNAQFTAKKFSYTSIEETEGFIPVENLTVDVPTTAKVHQTITATPTVTPANASLPTVGYEVPYGVVVSGNQLTFTSAGEFTVKAYIVDDPATYREFTVTVSDAPEYVQYPTTAEGSLNGFDHYYVGNATDGAAADIAEYFRFNADGTMTLKEKKGSGVDSGYSVLYMKDLMNGSALATKNFEIRYLVKSSDATPNGWHGVCFSMQKRSGVPNQVGVSAFIQEDALKATIWGGGKTDYGVDGPHEQFSDYTKGEWNLVKVRVYGDGATRIETYVNDMQTPAITYEASNGVPLGDLGLFMTTNVTVGNVSFAMLDTKGELLEIVYPESVTVINAVTTAKKGDSLQLQTSVTPANVTDGTLVYESSNLLVATVNDGGMVKFMTAGTVTITVSCAANPNVKQVMEITVTETNVLPTSVCFDVTPTNATVGGRDVLFVTVGPENATDYSVTFTSSNTAVATVDAEGRIEYVGAGKTTITVRCNAAPNVTASFELTVNAAANVTPTENTEGCGCGSSLGVSGAIAAVALLGVAVVGKTRKKED